MLKVAVVETKEVAKEIIYDLQDVLMDYDWEFHCYANLSQFANQEDLRRIDILVLPKRYNRQRVYHALIEPHPNMVVICTCENTEDGMISQILYINVDRIEDELNKNKEEILKRLKGRDILFFQYNQVKVPLKIMDIAYLEKEDKLIVYHTRRGIFKERGSIYEKAEMLAPYDFIRIHNSLVVNMNRIAYVDGEMVVLIDQTRLPISRSRRAEVVEKLRKHHR